MKRFVSGLEECPLGALASNPNFALLCESVPGSKFGPERSPETQIIQTGRRLTPTRGIGRRNRHATL